jgi:RNA 3'-terminal phosphate cyclase (ATP)
MAAREVSNDQAGAKEEAAPVVHVVDGSIMEGGGQILRNSFACCTLLHKALRVEKIRASRKPPGLRAQHAEGLVLTAALSGGKLDGAKIGSCEVDYTPGATVVGGEHVCNTGTAGSVALLVQVALPCLVFATERSRLTLGGGTLVAFAPPVEYLQHAFLPLVRTMGVEATIDIERRGFYPKGGGRAIVTATPVRGSLRPITLLDPGSVVRVRAVIIAAKLPNHIAKRAREHLKGRLGRTPLAGVPLEVDVHDDRDTLDPAMAVLLYAETSTGCILGSDGCGARGKPTEQVVDEAVDGLVEALGSGACVDRHMQDQLIIFMALAVRAREAGGSVGRWVGGSVGRWVGGWVAVGVYGRGGKVSDC